MRKCSPTHASSQDVVRQELADIKAELFRVLAMLARLQDGKARQPIRAEPLANFPVGKWLVRDFSRGPGVRVVLEEWQRRPHRYLWTGHA